MHHDRHGDDSPVGTTMKCVSSGVADILLLTQVFPPAVGGSGELMENIYSRIQGAAVTVLTDVDATGGSGATRNQPRIRRTPFNGAYWGVLNHRGLAQHVRLAGNVRAACRDRHTVVHCGRALPEGIPALLASKVSPYPKYLFWVHGEEIAAALTSRDFTWTMRRVHAGASFAVTNSQNSARVLGSVGFPPEKTRVVYPGVNSDRYHPSVDGTALRSMFTAPHGQLLASIGRLQRRKGHDLVLRAMKALESELPQLEYVIVGDGVERHTLEALTRELGLSGRVHFEGEVPGERLAEYYAAADIFVLATRIDQTDFEGFGLVFLEAAAAGRPVIAGRNGGVAEAVADGETGLLVEGDNVRELSDAIRALARSPALRAQLGAKGRSRVERQFSWQRAADQILAIHSELASQP
jgi:phosphatidylinositol alpha-1,6-mannosyltransferase